MRTIHRLPLVAIILMSPIHPLVFDTNPAHADMIYIAAAELLALPEFPPENHLIASTADGFITVYKLTTGEYQVKVGPPPTPMAIHGTLLTPPLEAYQKG